MSTPNTHLERRLTVRLIAYWERMRGQETMPAEAAIRQEDIEDLWPNCFLLRAEGEHLEHYHFLHLGEEIARLYHGGQQDPEEHQGFYAFNARTLGQSYDQVVKTCRPLVDEGAFRNVDGRQVKFRQCLLPLGEGGQVSLILGGMRFRVD